MSGGLLAVVAVLLGAATLQVPLTVSLHRCTALRNPPCTLAHPPLAGGSSSSSAVAHGPSEGTHPALDGSAGGFSHPPSTHKPALDRVLEALLSERGHSLVSVAVSLGARNLVSGFCEARHRLAAADRAAAGLGPQLPGAQPDLTNRLLDFLSTSHGQQLVRIAAAAAADVDAAAAGRLAGAPCRCGWRSPALPLESNNSGPPARAAVFSPPPVMMVYYLD